MLFQSRQRKSQITVACSIAICQQKNTHWKTRIALIIFERPILSRVGMPLSLTEKFLLLLKSPGLKPILFPAVCKIFAHKPSLMAQLSRVSYSSSVVENPKY